VAVYLPAEHHCLLGVQKLRHRLEVRLHHLLTLAAKLLAGGPVGG
jgi:hypothetical protein